MPEFEELSARVEVLEIKVAYQEDTLEKLNEIIIQQRDIIDEHRDKLNLLIEKIKTIPNSQMASFDEIEKPPHY